MMALISAKAGRVTVLPPVLVVPPELPPVVVEPPGAVFPLELPADPPAPPDPPLAPVPPVPDTVKLNCWYVAPDEVRWTI